MASPGLFAEPIFLFFKKIFFDFFMNIFGSVWLCQQSSWNRNLSVVRPSVCLWHRLSLKLLHGFLSNFSCGFPWAICRDVVFIFVKKKILNFLWIFLALLDYVSRAHEIEIRLSSVVRPSVASIISEVIAWISFKYLLWLPLGHMPRLFFSFLNKKKFEFFTNIFRFR